MDTHLLAHLANIGAAGNWQRSGGKGRRPKPLKGPDPRRPNRRARTTESLRRLRELGFIDENTR